jgi:hypothetical protein
MHVLENVQIAMEDGEKRCKVANSGYHRGADNKDGGLYR